MKAAWEKFGYQLCYRGDRLGDLWSRLWFRWYCPHPVAENNFASTCIAAGECGCSNLPQQNSEAK